MVATAESQAALVQTNLPKLKASQVVVELDRRDTLAAITLAIETIKRRDPEAIVVVTAADSFLEPNTCFGAVFERAHQAGIFESDALCCFGLVPARAETGFGYIHRGEALAQGVSKVHAFKEKPDRATAESYVDSGDYLWNAGSFAWRASAFLGEVERQQPELLAGIQCYLDTDPSQHQERRDIYAGLEKLSVDYGVMEGAREVVVLELDARFEDIGTWDAFVELGQLPPSNAISVDATNCVAIGEEDGSVAFVGVDDVIVVRQGERLLVMKRGAGQSVKRVHQQDRGV